MTAVQLHTRGALAPNQTHRAKRGALLPLLLAAALPLAAADIDPNRLIFEVLPSSDASPGSRTPATGAQLSAVNTWQPESDVAAADARPEQLLAAVAAGNARIATLVEQEGAFTPALIQEYLDLGRRYQALGRHEAAIEVLDDAEHLSRITDGLDNLALIEIAELGIPSHLALGQWADLRADRNSCTGSRASTMARAVLNSTRC